MTPPAMTTNPPEHVRDRCSAFKDNYTQLRSEIAKVIVGHEGVVDGILTALFVGGNVLLEGVPGLGKTMLIRTLGEVLQLKFGRIQFTPDLMPSDIIGTRIVMEDPESGRRSFEFQHGPIFTQLLLADEINRATPKSQSALLEAMQEGSVTVDGVNYQLERPFFVMATQNPIEQEGTYPLPEAQLDRFLFKLIVKTPNLHELLAIADRTTTAHNPTALPQIDAQAIIAAQHLVREVIIAPHVTEYAARLVLATHPEGEYAPEVTNRYIRCGASPRGIQALVLAGKVRALVDGRFHVSYTDVEEVVRPALRHRIILNFEAEADLVDTDGLVEEIVRATRHEPVLTQNAPSQI